MGARKLFERRFSRSSSTSSSSSSSYLGLESASESLTGRRSYGSALMSGRIKEIESIITQLDVDASASASSSASSTASLFDGRRGEVRRFFHAVSDLNHYMRYLNTAKLDGWSSGYSAQDEFVSTRRLMEIAMKRLQKEFFRMLSADRDGSGYHGAVTSCSGDEDEFRSSKWSDNDNDVKVTDQTGGVPTPTVLANLRSIANSMVSAGYAKECVKVYKNVRKSIVDKRIWRLGFQRLGRSQIEKLDAASVEHWIKNWLAAAVVVVKTIFAGERRLCDSVFDSSEKLKESCFAEITRDAAVHFLEFPGLVAATSKKASRWKPKSHSASPERIFHLLDLHNCITDLWPEIEKVFSYNATSSVQSQAISSLQTLSVSVGYMLADFENTIQRDTVKEPAIPGSGLHPLTRRVMDVLTVLSEYSPALDDVYYDHPLPAVEPPASTAPPSVSSRFAWLVLVLLCKLDAKADLYKDTSLSYLFLANNFRYIVRKVAASDKLREVLGDEWVKKHEGKARSFMASYERMGWAKKAAAMEDDEIEVFAEYGRSDR